MRFLVAVALACLFAAPGYGQDVRVTHGLSLFGDLRYPADFSHFDYTNPDAPKGGRVKLSAQGTYDTLNPFVIKGTPASGASMIYDSLMEQPLDDINAEYGLLAASVEVPEDLSWVAFNLRPEARWHDGKPITADDVVFSFNLLKEKGRPFFRFYYANVAKVEALGPHKVKFSFAGRKNRELPQIVGQLSVLPKHYWEGREFEATTLEPPLGSGPYRIAKVDPGRSITLERVDDYWAKDLPVNRGRYNYDHVSFEYYRDPTVSLEAFKAHGFDYRSENSSKVWATGYDFPAARAGAVVVEELPDKGPRGMQGFVFNTRRPQFRDAAVRQALAYSFDFEWSNKNLFYGQYARTTSYFENSELASRGLPDAAELVYLEPLRGRIPDEVFTRTYAPPKTDGSGRLRQNLRTAKKLLDEAGWKIVDGKLHDPRSGEPVSFEFLIVQQAFERVIAPVVKNLKRLGVTATIRLVDTSQYLNRIRDFDFDVVIGSWGQSLSPGNEQRDFWGSEAAERKGSRNLIGVKDPAIDALIDHVIFAETRAELVAATRALDRVLLWRHYVIPNFHNRTFRIAYWNRFSRPAVQPKYATGFFDSWWVDAKKDAALQTSGATSAK